MMFKAFLKNIFILSLILKWIKKQYVYLSVLKRGYFFAQEDSALQSPLIPLFRGYCLWKQSGQVHVKFEIGSYSSDAILFENDDLKNRYNKLNSSGYYHVLSPMNIPAGKELIIIFNFPGGIEKRYRTGWILDDNKKKAFQSAKTEKLNRVSEIIKCPSCDSINLTKHQESFNCNNCGSEYKITEHGYNFLTKELKSKGKVEHTPNISANTYDHESEKIIAKYQDGLILDNGSGLRGNYYNNVINFEITDYPTTDVIGIGEKLPFKDEVFDAAFSLNVLEHVKNPFLYVSELKRVVKKGGIIYTAAPFLQPYHGYPYHFFNMTSEGLKVLFEDTRIIKSGEVKMGHPIFGISWILNEYLNGLSGKNKRRFSRLKVKDLVKDPSEQLGKKYAKNLSKKARNIISCVNFVVCEKI